MQKMYDDGFLEPVIHITKQRDTRALGQTLLKTLAEIIDFKSLVLLHVSRTSADVYLEVAECVPSALFRESNSLAPYSLNEQGVERDEDMALCIKSAEIVSYSHNGVQRFLTPVIVNNVVTDVLDIHGHSLTSSTQKIIYGIVSIFSNFLTVLDDNEHDTLTGLLNRKTFDLRLTELIDLVDEKNNVKLCAEGERREGKAHTYHWAGILDIDHFKNINDTYGHVYGDEILLLFSNIMEKSFRSSDLLFRYGGEEFVVVLHPATEADAMMVYERFRRELEAYEFPQVGCVTVSIGVVKIDDQDHPTTVLEHADQALYFAKDNGRNQVRNYHELLRCGDIKELHVGSETEFF